METELPYTEQFDVGDHVILKLRCDDIFEGDLVDMGKNRIDIKNPRQRNVDNRPRGIYSFYRNEIDTIKVLRAKATEKSSPLCKVEERLKLSATEYERLKDMTTEYVYLDKADSRYFQAINLLTKAETIGVVGLGLEKSRSATIKLLAVCTWDQVYLFDFINHKQKYFYPELKDILEAECTCKIIHEAGPLLDIFYRQYNVYVHNTFDTQIVDLVIKRKETRQLPTTLSNISQLLTDYLNFPESYLKNALETTNKKWGERPLSDRRKGYAAQLVTYLITLRDHMQKKLFGELYESIEKIHDFYYLLDSYQFSKNWQEKTIPKEIQNLIPDLSKEVLPIINSNVPPVENDLAATSAVATTVGTPISDTKLYCTPADSVQRLK